MNTEYKKRYHQITIMEALAQLPPNNLIDKPEDKLKQKKEEVNNDKRRVD